MYSVDHQIGGIRAVAADKWTDWIPEDSASRSCLWELVLEAEMTETMR